MDLIKLKELEQNKSIIEKYIKSASFGKNKLMYLPLCIGLGLAFFIIFVVFDGMIKQIGILPLVILSVICICCFITVKIINNASLKKIKAVTHYAPLCVARKIYGNDNEQVYYCIYTSGDKRHDTEFINSIAEKIFAIPHNTNNSIEKQINKLFHIDLTKPNEFAKKLPIEFTEGETIWRRQFSLFSLSKEIKQKIEEDKGNFVVVAINPENAKFVHDYYI